MVQEGSGKTPVIGVLCNLPELSREMLAGIMDAAEGQELEIQVLPAGLESPDYPGEGFRKRIAGLLDSPRLDGLISFSANLAARESAEALESLLLPWRNRPLVSMGRRIFSEPVVSIHEYPGLDKLFHHVFHDHGYRNPAFILAPEYAHEARQRNACLLRALDTYGLPRRREMIRFGTWSLNSGREMVRELFAAGASRPDVVICANDHMALGALYEIMQMGILVPGDVAVTGYDGFIMSRDGDNPLCTVKGPEFEAGRQGLTSLLAVMRGDIPGDNTLDAVFQPGLTCGCLNLVRTPWHPLLARRMNELDTDVRGAWMSTAVAIMESYEHMDSWYHLRHVDNMIADWVRSMFLSLSLEGHREEAAQTLDPMGIGNFWLVVFDRTDGSLPPRARVVFGRNNWIMEDIPPGGISFSPRNILPESIHPTVSLRTQILPLRSGNFHLGYLVADWRKGMEDTFVKLCNNLASASLWIIENLKLQQMNQALEEARTHLETLSLTDELTTLHNRRGFLSLAEQQMAYCKRMNRSCSILYMDMDGLKHINDTWGHQEGDQAIQTFAGILGKIFRDSDVTGRLGGDEFVALLPETDDSILCGIRQRLGEAMEETNRQIRKPWKISASTGEATNRQGEKKSLDMLMQEADARLYEEKKRRKKQ